MQKNEQYIKSFKDIIQGNNMYTIEPSSKNLYEYDEFEKLLEDLFNSKINNRIEKLKVYYYLGKYFKNYLFIDSERLFYTENENLIKNLMIEKGYQNSIYIREVSTALRILEVFNLFKNPIFRIE